MSYRVVVLIYKPGIELFWRRATPKLSTWQEVETYLQQSKGIIFPIGSTEQHGPTGLIGTDAICAEAIAHGVGDATNWSFS